MRFIVGSMDVRRRRAKSRSAKRLSSSRCCRPLPLTWQYGYGGLDEKTGRVASFTPLASLCQQAVSRRSATFPDPKLSYLMLNAQGGHPGITANEAAIRRWTVPVRWNVVSIKGTLNHPAQQGNGVRGARSFPVERESWQSGRCITNKRLTEIPNSQGQKRRYPRFCGGLQRRSEFRRLHMVAASLRKRSREPSRRQTKQRKRGTLWTISALPKRRPKRRIPSGAAISTHSS